MKFKVRGRILWAAVALAIAAGVIFAFLPRAVRVETATVTRGAFLQTIDDDGRTRVRDRFLVSAPLAGTIERVRLKAGDRVEQGRQVAVISPSMPSLHDVRTEVELNERLGAAEASRARAASLVQRVQAQQSQANVDYGRSRQLAEAGTISRSDLDRARLTLEVTSRELAAARLEEHAAEHEVAQAKAALARFQKPSPETAATPFEVLSPITGEVLRVIQESEGPVALGAPIMEVADPTDLEVVVDVLSIDAVQIRSGADVRLERWGGGEPLEGRVRRVEPSAFMKISALGVEEQRVNVVIDFTSARERWATLGDGFKVDARIVVYSADNAIKVSAGALFRHASGWAVYVVEHGHAYVRPVEIGRRAVMEAEVKSGLEPSERVIVFPSDKIRDGVAVTIQSGTT